MRQQFHVLPHQSKNCGCRDDSYKSWRSSVKTKLAISLVSLYTDTGPISPSTDRIAPPPGRVVSTVPLFTSQLQRGLTAGSHGSWGVHLTTLPQDLTALEACTLPSDLTALGGVHLTTGSQRSWGVRAPYHQDTGSHGSWDVHLTTGSHGSWDVHLTTGSHGSWDVHLTIGSHRSWGVHLTSGTPRSAAENENMPTGLRRV